jgi:uncharacterized protein (TIGR04222 family)
MTSTWGSDRWFLGLYVLLLGLAGLAAGRAYWAAAKPTSHRLGDPIDLDPYELAVLNRREAQVVTIALTNLLQTGSIEIGSPANGIVTGRPLPPGAHPVERVVYTLIDQNELRSLRAVRIDARKAAVLDDLRDKLRRQGLLRNQAHTRRARLQALWFAPVMALAIVWLVAHLPGDNGWQSSEAANSFITVVLLTFGTAIVFLAAQAPGLWAVYGPPRRTIRGHRTLGRLHRRYAHLSPELSGEPVATGALPWAMALFGMQALRNTDRLLAAALESPSETATRHMKKYAKIVLRLLGD